MVYEYKIRTGERQMANITRQVREAVSASGALDGLCVVYCPHTTAGITINENADPDVQADVLLGLDRAFADRPEFRHMEGNSSAHLKAACVGTQTTVILKDGALLLGRWQGIYFCEFDGPRSRTFYVKIMQG